MTITVDFQNLFVLGDTVEKGSKFFIEADNRLLVCFALQQLQMLEDVFSRTGGGNTRQLILSVVVQGIFLGLLPRELNGIGMLDRGAADQRFARLVQTNCAKCVYWVSRPT